MDREPNLGEHLGAFCIISVCICNFVFKSFVCFFFFFYSLHLHFVFCFIFSRSLLYFEGVLFLCVTKSELVNLCVAIATLFLVIAFPPVTLLSFCFYVCCASLDSRSFRILRFHTIIFLYFVTCLSILYPHHTYLLLNIVNFRTNKQSCY